MRKHVHGIVAVGVYVLAAFMLLGCAAIQQAAGNRTETIVISYETMAMIGFPTVLAYLQEREKNGSLAGDQLANAKAQYALARATFINAGDTLKTYIQSPSAALLQQFPLLLRQSAVMLADLSGGKVEGNNLTVPKAGGVQ